MITSLCGGVHHFEVKGAKGVVLATLAYVCGYFRLAHNAVGDLQAAACTRGRLAPSQLDAQPHSSLCSMALRTQRTCAMRVELA